MVLGRKIPGNCSKKKSLVEKDESFFYIPSIESLSQLLSNKQMAKWIIRKPKQCDGDIYYDICDGQIFNSDKTAALHIELSSQRGLVASLIQFKWTKYLRHDSKLVF